jgi:hypothetical protein
MRKDRDGSRFLKKQNAWGKPPNSSSAGLRIVQHAWRARALKNEF